MQVAKQVLLVAESRAQGAKLAYQELEEKSKNMVEVSQLDERTSELQGLRARVEDLESQLRIVTAVQARAEATERQQQAVQLVLGRVERLQQAQLLTEDEHFAVEDLIADYCGYATLLIHKGK